MADLKSGISFYFEACQGHASEFEAGTDFACNSIRTFLLVFRFDVCELSMSNTFDSG